MDANQDHADPNGDANSNTNTKASPIDISSGRTSRSRTGSEETERPPSGQPRQQSEATTEDEEMDLDPAEPIISLDWDNLAERYHQQMADCEKRDAALMEEWENLMAFFQIWASSGNAHETERTYHRLYTRMAHVQNSESKLEKTRQHYTNVVKAFESALQLLRA
ncbi:hypothetical protein BCR34DRAFT_479246 [Clohesyomyces aquaticus]|uniref:Uncharacterized protein n=1 Tax=Clohesyomyces aquaticus TaxID=1231657 RepID=A0A1Y1ZWH2_9PLEO|nr:hypothetical protein BCR34DRAFT_479246 [Clohesyomyces aquaticus]